RRLDRDRIAARIAGRLELAGPGAHVGFDGPIQALRARLDIESNRVAGLVVLYFHQEGVGRPSQAKECADAWVVHVGTDVGPENPAEEPDPTHASPGTPRWIGELWGTDGITAVDQVQHA